MSSIVSILKERGLLESCTPDLEESARSPLKVYCGFDPSSDSLHLGNLLPIVVLAWFKRLGHQPVVIVGGATGMIGDPGGKAHERQLLDYQTLSNNTSHIHRQLDTILNRGEEGEGALPIYNNYDWFSQYNVLEFLRDVGKHFRLGPMLAKEMVRTRLQSEEGMSFTEFSYQLLQGYDFLHLFRTAEVRLQIGGSDQWGNITAGIELIRKMTGEPAHGLVFPLLTKSDGQKFGKSEKGAIWLSAEKLSPYDFYQYLYRVSDEDAIKLLRMLTFIPLDEVEEYARGGGSPNIIQKRLAEEVTRFVHGDEGVKMALAATLALTPGKETTLDSASIQAFKNSSSTLSLERALILGKNPLDLFILAQLVPSKTEGRKMIANGGLYLNNAKVTLEQTLTLSDLVEGRYLLLAVGKKNKMLIELY